MNRDQVVEVLTKHLKLNVPGLEETAVDLDKPLEEYGASSLDTVEIVSAAMRELGVRIPRKELSDVTHLRALADLFLRHAPATQTASE